MRLAKIIFGVVLLLQLYFMPPLVFAEGPNVGDIVLVPYNTNISSLGGYWSGWYVVLNPNNPPWSARIDSVAFSINGIQNPLARQYLPAFVNTATDVRYYYPTGPDTYNCIAYRFTPVSADPTWSPPENTIIQNNLGRSDCP
jgi:hypothetical protein